MEEEEEDLAEKQKQETEEAVFVLGSWLGEKIVFRYGQKIRT